MKTALRAEALERRDRLDAETREAAAEAIARAVESLASRLPGGVVAAYWPIRREADPRPSLARLRTLGHASALPVVTPDRLLFRLWAEADTLAPAPFGLMEPLGSAPLVEPATLLVPLAAFDRRGHRIGYGKGHYDRTLAVLPPVTTVGIAYSVQEIPAIPDEPHDHPLDFVVTEREIVDCRQNRRSAARG
ncbi:MAG: 5-formyltetrahydrofolate cyclo-ligase [Hyphomicrobiales bacterium]|nr:5-formyltetrahydrofolate cyclo-ligase [Hyphomicrobiales bacterium]